MKPLSGAVRPSLAFITADCNLDDRKLSNTALLDLQKSSFLFWMPATRSSPKNNNNNNEKKNHAEAHSLFRNGLGYLTISVCRKAIGNVSVVNGLKRIQSMTDLN
jgi:hypothetical protein